MKRYVAAASAALISFALASPIAAQDLALKQLQDSAMTSMAQLNMDTSMIEVLTLDELTQIQGVNSGSSTPESKKMRIETILREADDRIAAGGAVVPTGPAGDITAADLEGIADVRHNVRADIAKLGMNSDIDVDLLTNDQLMQIQLVTSNVSNEAEQKMAIEKIVSN